MPLKSGKNAIGENIAELHGGKVFARTRKKFWKKRAQAQSIAIAMRKAGKKRVPPKERMAMHGMVME